MRTTLAMLLVAAVVSSTVAQPKSNFKAGKHGPAELKFVSGLPVLTVSGKPAEIGEQIGVLVGKNSPDPTVLLNDFMKEVGLKDAYPLMKKSAAGLKGVYPADHVAEMEAIAKTSGQDVELLLLVNGMYDLIGGFGCSTLVVEKDRSGTGQPLFGRNFDWRVSKGLPEQTLILVAKPAGKRAFATFTFAPVTGVFSGMNDAGLCVTNNQIFSRQSKDGGKTNWAGVPTLMAFRRVLEECKTVAEAEKLIRGMKRMSTVCMTVCDATGGAVFEISPENVSVRKADNGVCCCTNHFCSDSLGVGEKCRRLEKLVTAQKATDKLGVDDVFAKLHEVNQDKATMQAMVFEPATKTVHLKVSDGTASATKAKAVTLELGKMFE
jgi:predicted choloylglycine hydrolase